VKLTHDERKNLNEKWMASKAKATKVDDLHVDRTAQRSKNFSQANLFIHLKDLPIIWKFI
jgi:hypothetical protein